MSLSTSSSETADRSAERRTWGRILLAILAGMAVSLVVLRVFTDLNDASEETILGRVSEARAALPNIIAQPENLVMFYGSSMVEAGFSPRMFDRWMAERGVTVKSFNFGFGGLNPYFQEILSRRIAEQFDASGRRLELALIEFNPFQTTTTRWEGAEPIVDSFLTMLATDRELLEIAKRDPERGVRLFTIRYLRNDISAEMITAFFGRALQPRPQESDIPEDEAMEKRREEVLEALEGRFEEDYPDYDGSDWYWPWQGGGTIPLERSQETVELIKELIHTGQSERRMDNDRLFRIRTADILQLRFEELLVESFIELVKNFQGFSEQVKIVLLPRNRDWIEYTPEGWARLDAVIERIARETGVEVVNLQDTPEITPSMFGDTTHLGRYAGDVPFTRVLVDRFGPLLTKP